MISVDAARYGTAAEWLVERSIPSVGEFCIESDTLRIKIGNGVTPFTSLPYANSSAYASSFPFTGVFSLSRDTVWPDLVQTGALVLSEGSLSAVGGCDAIKITANGSGITVPGAWKNVGTDAISPTNADINRIIVMKMPEGIWYTNKLN